MKLLVPTNWQDDLIPAIQTECVEELYGKLAADSVGGGRASSFSVPVSRKDAAAHIAEARKEGLRFNYLLNATCTDNMEWTRRGQRRFHRLLDWLVQTGVSSVTVATPYLMQMVKHRHPQLEAHVSTQAGVNTAERAKYWEELGADCITLSVVDVNRQFFALREIRAAVDCRLQLIGNLDCLYMCPYYGYHANLHSHASQVGHRSRGFMIDYCSLLCRRSRLAHPVEFIRSPWIRPEDVHYYEELGINSIKFVNRGMTTQAIAEIVQAYSTGRHEGDLLDILGSDPRKNLAFAKPSLLRRIRYFFRPFSVNLFKLSRGRNLFQRPPIHIANRKLDGFLKPFLTEDCRVRTCASCRYCDEVADQVVEVDTQKRDKIVEDLDAFLSQLTDGGMFRYMSRK